MEWVSELFEFLSWLGGFLTGSDEERGLIGLIEDATAWFLVELTIWKIKAALVSIKFFWGVASSVLDQIGANGWLQSAWDALPEGARAVCVALRIPEAINMILTSAVARWAMGAAKI